MEIQIPLPEQLENESNSDYSLFLIYLRMPRPRIIKNMINLISDEQLLTVINYSHHYLIDLSGKHKWKQRADTYDLQQEQHIITLQQQHEITKATEFPEKENKTIKVIDLLKERTLTCLQSKTQFKPYELKNIAQTLEVIQKGERLANGQTTENKNTTAEIQTKQEQTIELTKTETLLDDDFMNKQIEYGLKLIRKLEQ